MAAHYLEFERPIADLEAKIEELSKLSETTGSGTLDAEIEALRARIGERMAVAKDRLADAEAAIVDSGKKAVRVTDDYVHENPWQSVGVAAGVAFLLGLLVSRR